MRRLRGMVSKYRGGVLVDPAPADGRDTMIAVHASGLPLFALMRLNRDLRWVLEDALASNLRPKTGAAIGA